MKRGLTLIILITALFLAVIPSVSAIAIQKTTINNVVAQELSVPAKFSLTMTNPSTAPDYVEFYTLVDAIIAPKGSVKLEGGETKTITLEVYPSEKLKQSVRGGYTFVYYIKSAISGLQEDRLVIKILSLKDIVELEIPDKINFETSQIPITFRNNESIALEEIKVSIDSSFIKDEEKFSLGALEEKKFDIDVDAKKLRTLVAGNYLVTFKMLVNSEATFKLEKEVSVSAESNIITEEIDEGNWLVPIKIITKKNNGNTIAVAEIVVTKGFFGKYFTSFSQKPEIINRGFSNTYYWNIQLKPQESVTIEIRTSHIIPILIFLAIIVVIIILYVLSKEKLTVKKKVLRVRTKGGEFAFKVVLLVRARDDVSQIIVKDRLPRLTELHERFGTEGPSKIDSQRKMLEWDILELKKGQEKIFSYIAYSKVHVLGRFELPKAHLTFTHKGKTKYALSNATYLLAEEHSV